ncbi:MAG: hypothetical protein AAB518_03880 [Patescibacteria group bacterium]
MYTGVLYLAERFFFRIVSFLRHWYVDGLRTIARETMNVLEPLDRTFALRITAKNLFQPLYQDHTVVGHVLGFVFRSLRLSAGSLVYSAILVVAITVAVVWAGIPISILWYGIHP